MIQSFIQLQNTADMPQYFLDFLGGESEIALIRMILIAASLAAIYMVWSLYRKERNT